MTEPHRPREAVATPRNGSPLSWRAVSPASLSGWRGYTGSAALQAMRRWRRHAGPAQETAQRIAPLVRGEVAALTVANAPKRPPDLAFKDGNGARKTLADWRGKTVLFNLWATWCVPCRKEMPALDALQAKLGGPDFEVVAINIDTRDPRETEGVAEGGRHRRGSVISPTHRQGVPGPEGGRQGVRHADHAADRPQRLRARRRWRVRRNGRATTRSSSSPRRCKTYGSNSDIEIAADAAMRHWRGYSCSAAPLRAASRRCSRCPHSCAASWPPWRSALAPSARR